MAEKMVMKRLIFFLLVAATVWKFYSDPGRVSLGPGVMAAGTPKQYKIGSPESFRHEGFQITPLAKFKIKAKVLSREEYSLDRWSDISPIDLALGWGRMSDESIVDKIDISQSGRWYRWQSRVMPIPAREIETHSANMHMIPASDGVQDEIGRARTGDIISLVGKLVKVQTDDGWSWESSLTRKDTGDGACEIIWVERFEVVSN